MGEVDYEKLAMEVFDELNIARQVPNAIVSSITSKLTNFDDKILRIPGMPVVETYEGAKAVIT